MALGNMVEAAVRPLYVRARLLEERLRSGVAWWPLAESFVADPYPAYRKLRERDPVHYSILTEEFVVSRYADVDRILRDHRNFSNDPGKGRSSLRSRATRRNLNLSILQMDPPDHSRLRRLVNQAFTPRSIAKLEEDIRVTAHGLLDGVESSGEFDLMKAFAVPLPMIVIAKMIGVPETDLDRFKLWSDRMTQVLEPFLTAEEEEAVYRSDRELREYFGAIVERRRSEPRDDLVSRLVQAGEQSDRLTPGETVEMLRLILVAGNETTTNLIGNGVRALLQNPGQLELLRERPELGPSAVVELLRYDSPVQLDMRVALRDLKIAGRPVRPGTSIALLIGSANHDPRRFERPTQLDITRPEKGSIAFGRGIHHCLGAQLARLEGRIALEALLERFGSIGFGARTPRHRPSIVLRGLEHLDVRVRGSG